MVKVHQTFGDLSLNTRQRLSTTTTDPEKKFSLNNQPLKEFLDKALAHLDNATHKQDACQVAHFLMGIKTTLPAKLQSDSPALSQQQKSQLNDLLRTSRYGIFGAESADKTIEKLKALKAEVELDIRYAADQSAIKNPVNAPQKQAAEKISKNAGRKPSTNTNKASQKNQSISDKKKQKNKRMMRANKQIEKNILQSKIVLKISIHKPVRVTQWTIANGNL